MASQLRALTACSLLLLCVSVSRASAAPVLVLLNGHIATAQGVVVDGKTYDVDFLDGFCTDVFLGCNASTSFAFDTVTQAKAASQALLDTVLLNLGTFETAFDGRFNLTNGCEGIPGVNFNSCQIITPYGITVTGGGTNFVVEAANVRNGGDNANDPTDEVKDFAIDVTVFPDGQTLPQSFFSPGQNYTWARWRLRSTNDGDDDGTTGTAPEPATSVLLLSAVAVGLARRRRRARAA